MATSGKRPGRPPLLGAAFCLTLATTLPAWAQEPAFKAFNGLAPTVTSVPNSTPTLPQAVPSLTPTPPWVQAPALFPTPPGPLAFNSMAPKFIFDPHLGHFVIWDPEGMAEYMRGAAEYMRGTADIMSAGGNLAIQLRQAELVNQDVVSAKITNRRRLWDQWLYERYNLPTLQDERERAGALATRRALTDPPTTEILTATTLNQLLRSLKGRTYGRPIPLDANVLKQINVVDPAGGNLGALKPAKEGNSLNWPRPLKGAAYQEEVKEINRRVAEALKQANFKGEVDPGTLSNLTDAIARLRARVRTGQDALTLMQQLEANRFLNQLDAADHGLGKPKAADLLTGKLSPRGRTVPELLQNMYGSGMEFAPATDGDEAAYVALYNALLVYAQSVGLGATSVGQAAPSQHP